MAMNLHKKRELLLHAAFWAVYLSFITLHITSTQTGPNIHLGRVLLGSLISLCYLLSLSYLNYFYLIPAFLLKNKIGAFIILFIAFFAAFTLARIGIEILVFGRAWELQSAARTEVIIQSVIDLFIVLFIGLLRFAFNWLELDSRRRQLETEKLNAELKFLKAQVNPHFFFNTLNNLYYLSTIKSDTAPLIISKLSEVMRYMIYDSNHAQIPLSKEIEFMQHYIALERLRVKETIPLEFEVAGKTDIFISPLILIAFLENAFKHGINGSDSCWIKARLEVEGNRLVYTIANSKIKKMPHLAEGEGIGLSNVKRRLDLTYPGRHQLSISNQDDSYSVTLTIDQL
ncbi:MAG: sensor histidine kinase [Bacteroidetes bacterium]|nr:MAG: sensor histidine kinase [Bacteroidota bacterium]